MGQILDSNNYKVLWFVLLWIRFRENRLIFGFFLEKWLVWFLNIYGYE